eukprot:CAMPEP_0114618888 /NCGR_PEP_ID=MMETSP0168-20121206/7931_1 /TAXON_ID=95228 ORGANISM="Vannella sp., Strain DIVA3 517/6/12" /NCGR_SAMPLE_ID=MMETSP0168 /ASSEMBLY_ACC=CAM_ASM_000044 /LENGTH=558 /DNA_ID=CAMNT_0001830041 /DNA_START=148 /DNA_END=1821 /DNA_ORIENTATION=+
MPLVLALDKKVPLDLYEAVLRRIGLHTAPFFGWFRTTGESAGVPVPFLTFAHGNAEMDPKFALATKLMPEQLTLAGVVLCPLSPALPILEVYLNRLEECKEGSMEKKRLIALLCNSLAREMKKEVKTGEPSPAVTYAARLPEDVKRWFTTAQPTKDHPELCLFTGTARLSQAEQNPLRDLIEDASYRQHAAPIEAAIELFPEDTRRLLEEGNGSAFRGAASAGTLSLVKLLLRLTSAKYIVKAWPNGEKSLLLTAACKPFGRHNEEGNRMLPWMLKVARRILPRSDDEPHDDSGAGGEGEAEAEEDKESGGKEDTAATLVVPMADAGLWAMSEEEKAQFAVDFRREFLLCCEAAISRGSAEDLEMLFDMTDDNLLEELGNAGALASCPQEVADDRPLTRLLAERMPKNSWLQVDLEGRTPLFAAVDLGNWQSIGVMYAACPEALLTPCKGEYVMQRFVKVNITSRTLHEFLAAVEQQLGPDVMAQALATQNPSDGFTCLRQAVEKPDMDVASYAGADLDVLEFIRSRMPSAAVGLRDSSGKTAIERYCELNEPENQDA